MTYGAIDDGAVISQALLAEDGIAIARLSLAENCNTGTECKDCGEEIPAARRAAIPGALRCIQCQQKHQISWVCRDRYIP